MQDHTSPRSVENTIAAQKYGIGQPVVRKEDDTLVRGKGKYTDDLNLPGQAYAVIVRSTHPHGVLKKVDTTEAKKLPGVLGIWTGEDMVAAGYGNFVSRMPLKSKDGTPLLQSNKPILAVGKVRFVGDPIAVVVAETLAQAKDAAEAVEVDIDPLPAVTRAADAIKPGAPQLYESVPNNMVLDYHYGDTAKVDEAFAKAAHVAKLDLDNTRVAVVAMEPRAGIGDYDKKRDFYTLHVPTQGVSGNRVLLATLLKVKADQIRILTGNVGGSFGMKSVNYPEYTCILHASKMLGRPVKWTDERSGSFLSDSHGRASEVTGELALDSDGNFLAVRIKGFGNVGGYLAGVMPSPLSLGIAKNIASVYKTPLIEVNIKCVLTNTTVNGAYRGAGRPEANYFMERLIERAADEMGIDRIQLRKKNLVKSAQMPYNASSGMQYDSGDFPGRDGERAEGGRLRGLRQAQEGEPQAGQAARHRGRLLSRGHGAAEQGARQDRVRQGRRRDADHRHARLWPGPRLALFAGAVRPARRAVRQDPPRAGRQRHRPRRQRHRRLALDHGQRPGDRRSLRARHRKGQGSRRPRARSVVRRHRVRRRKLHHRRHRPRHQHPRSGEDAAGRQGQRRSRPRSTSIMSRTRCRPPSRTAATSPRSRSIRTPARSPS